MAEDRRRPVLSKRDCTARWARGEFGNKIPSWPSVEAFIEEPNPPDDTFTVRCTVPGSPFCAYNLARHEVLAMAAEFVEEGADYRTLYVNQSATNDELLTLQGEVMRGPRGLELRYSTARKKMRLALAEDEHNAHGLTALEILRSRLDATSLEWLEHLLDEYPDHVVEFSTWSCPMGDLGWNTIFWEVRKY